MGCLAEYEVREKREGGGVYGVQFFHVRTRPVGKGRPWVRLTRVFGLGRLGGEGRQGRPILGQLAETNYS